jgi:hypothetical protein
MGETVAGIALPEGDPGAAADAASGLRSAGGGFERTASTTQSAVGIVGSWEGVASFTFRDRCGGYQDAAASAQAACERAALALRRYGARLEEGRERVRRLQDRAEECVERIEAAEARAEDARERGNFASRMAFQSSFASAADAGATAASFRDQANMAYTEAATARAQADRARDELERLRRAAEDEREAVLDAGRTAAGIVEAAQGGLPTVAYPVREAAAAAAAARAEEEEDKPWYEDVGGAIGDAASWTGEQVVGVGKGIGEGVVGIGEGGLMLYRLSLTNALIDRDSWEREWSNAGEAAQFAWENPGEFGQAVINWEDLSEGRYGEWLGNLGPDAVVAVATAGTGTVATRGLRGADTVGDVADAARDADRAADAARHAPPDRAPRPTWQQSEVDVGERLGPGYEPQRSFMGGDPVPGNTQGSVRPDWYAPGDAVEVKNYDVETTAGRSRLVRNVGDQLAERTAHLPEGTAQRVVVDIRGQELAIPERRVLAERIAERSGGAVRPADITFMEEG